MTRDEFIDLLTEELTADPDNNRLNRILEAADEYAENEKAQLSQEGTTKDATSDLISRQAALDALDKRFDNIPMEQTAEILMLQKDLRELSTIQPEPQWIPVSERLPEVHESGNFVSGIYMQSNPVLVYGTCEYEDNAQFHVVTYCDDLDGNTYWSTELDAITVSGVLAWMPLPEPYKPNNE